MMFMAVITAPVLADTPAVDSRAAAVNAGEEAVDLGEMFKEESRTAEAPLPVNPVEEPFNYTAVLPAALLLVFILGMQTSKRRKR